MNDQPEGQSINNSDLADAYYRSGNYKAALPIYESLLQKTDKQKAFGSYIYRKKRIALLHAKLNDKTAAESILSELKAIDYKYDFGCNVDYYRLTGSVMKNKHLEEELDQERKEERPRLHQQ